LPGTVSLNGAIVCEQQPAIAGVFFKAFPLFLTVRYEVRKRTTVTPSFYSASTGTIANVSVLVYQGNTTEISTDATIAGNWTLNDQGETGFTMQPVNRSSAITGSAAGSPGIPGAEAIALFHFVADARLGIV
jgi:hypothetical protein